MNCSDFCLHCELNYLQLRTRLIESYHHLLLHHVGGYELNYLQLETCFTESLIPFPVASCLWLRLWIELSTTRNSSYWILTPFVISWCWYVCQQWVKCIGIIQLFLPVHRDENAMLSLLQHCHHLTYTWCCLLTSTTTFYIAVTSWGPNHLPIFNLKSCIVHTWHFMNILDLSSYCTGILLQKWQW